MNWKNLKFVHAKDNQLKIFKYKFVFLSVFYTLTLCYLKPALHYLAQMYPRVPLEDVILKFKTDLLNLEYIFSEILQSITFQHPHLCLYYCKILHFQIMFNSKL